MIQTIVHIKYFDNVCSHEELSWITVIYDIKFEPNSEFTWQKIAIKAMKIKGFRNDKIYFI